MSLGEVPEHSPAVQACEEAQAEALDFKASLRYIGRPVSRGKGRVVTGMSVIPASASRDCGSPQQTGWKDSTSEPWVSLRDPAWVN